MLCDTIKSMRNIGLFSSVYSIIYKEEKSVNRKDVGTVYEVPELEIVQFEYRDIVTSSALSDDESPNYHPGSWT